MKNILEIIIKLLYTDFEISESYPEEIKLEGKAKEIYDFLKKINRENLEKSERRQNWLKS